MHLPYPIALWTFKKATILGLCLSFMLSFPGFAVVHAADPAEQSRLESQIDKDLKLILKQPLTLAFYAQRFSTTQALAYGLANSTNVNGVAQMMGELLNTPELSNQLLVSILSEVQKNLQ